MAAVLVKDCPHCKAQMVTFSVAGEHASPLDNARWNLLATCGACGAPIAAQVHRTSLSHGRTHNPGGYPGNLEGSDSNWRLLAIWPQPVTPEIPDSIPDGVRNAFRQGLENMVPPSITDPNVRKDEAACSMFGRAMELALKDLSPDVEAWKLERRIDKLAELGRITPAMQEWAHEIRLDRNATLHSDETPNAMIAEQVYQFTKHLLTYLYTLPAQVEAARQRRNEG